VLGLDGHAAEVARQSVTPACCPEPSEGVSEAAPAGAAAKAHASNATEPTAVPDHFLGKPEFTRIGHSPSAQDNPTRASGARHAAHATRTQTPKSGDLEILSH
jgi:hypothetical protein